MRKARSLGRSVGVISVDPSSPFSHGALLGDRIRLTEHFVDADVFIRSMASRGHLGGVAGATADTLLLMDAFGLDVVLIETVGVGQSEIEVAELAQTTLVALQPGSGDSVQVLKAGIMEIADVFIVNKADHPMANMMKREIRSMMEMLSFPGWVPELVMTQALSGEGIDDLWVRDRTARRVLERNRRDRTEAARGVHASSSPARARAIGKAFGRRTAARLAAGRRSVRSGRPNLAAVRRATTAAKSNTPRVPARRVKGLT